MLKSQVGSQYCNTRSTSFVLLCERSELYFLVSESCPTFSSVEDWPGRCRSPVSRETSRQMNIRDQYLIKISIYQYQEFYSSKNKYHILWHFYHFPSMANNWVIFSSLSSATWPSSWVPTCVPLLRIQFRCKLNLSRYCLLSKNNWYSPFFWFAPLRAWILTRVFRGYQRQIPSWNILSNSGSLGTPVTTRQLSYSVRKWTQRELSHTGVFPQIKS